MADNQYWNPMVPELLVNDFDKSLHFYTAIMGFKVRYSREKPNFVYLTQEKVQLMLEQIHEDAWITAKLGYPLGRGINLQMEFSDIEPIYQRLKKLEYPLFRDIQDVWYNTETAKMGQREFLIQDPDGYLLRLTQYLGEQQILE